MKAIIDRAASIGDKVNLEIERALHADQLRISVKFEDGSGQGIVVKKQDVIDALKAF